jgi:hypothetical protein
MRDEVPALLADIEQARGPFHSRWVEWRPDPGRPAPTLPV